MSAEEPNRPACAGHDPELFFPESQHHGRRSPGYRADVARAKSICAGCPVQAECLDRGLREERFGVWGGLDQYARADLRRERGISLPIRKPWEAALRELSTEPAAVSTREYRRRQREGVAA